MTWDESCTRLRDILADIYFEAGDAKRLARDALLDVTQIDFRGSSVNFWTAIITVAEQNGQLLELIKRVRKEYPRNQELIVLEVEVELRRRVTRHQRPAEIPRLLLYLPDREEHEYEIKYSLLEVKNSRNRPLVYTYDALRRLQAKCPM